MLSLDNKITQDVYSTFEHLYENPEISWKEIETTKYIKDLLINLGFEVQTFSDSTGLVASTGTGKPVVGLRADIDALWQEVDGIYKANHSCGHDAHMAIVLGVAMLIKGNQNSINGTVKLIFQPAEETGTGALKLIENGVADNLDYLFGVHLRPIQELSFGTASTGISHGAGTLIKGQITGEDMHGARPHLGVSAIEVGSELVQKLNQIHLNPLVPHSVKLTSFVAEGGSYNIIPGSARFSIDLRAQTNEVSDELRLKVNEAISSLQDYHGITIKHEVVSHFPAAVIDSNAKSHLKVGIAHVLGESNTTDEVITSGGDDFHYYKIKNPELKATMLGLGSDLTPGLHNAHMTFNKEAIEKGVLILYNTLLNVLGTSQNPTSNK